MPYIRFFITLVGALWATLTLSASSVLMGVMVLSQSLAHRSSSVLCAVQLVFWLSIFSALSCQKIVDPYLRLSTCWILAVGTSYLVQQYFFGTTRRKIPKNLFLWALAVALLVNIDTFLIYAKSGWETLYFRPPFTHDIQRNVVIVNALLRDGKSPYLPDATFAYQLLWYHFASLFVPFFRSLSNYANVAGVTLFTAVFFSFLLSVFLGLLRPRILKHALVLILLVLIFSHGDIFYHLAGSLFEGRPSLEVDWVQRNGVFYRYFSLKSMMLISPQHVFFFVFWCGLLIAKKIGCAPHFRTLTGYSTMMTLCSPVLSLMTLPFLVLERLALKCYGEGLSVLLGLIIAGIVHPVVFGFSVIDLLLRPTGEKFLFPADVKSWLWSIPFLWVSALGSLGIALLCTFLMSVKKLKIGWEVLFLFLGLFVFHFVVTHSEVRKYASLIGGFAAAVFVARYFSIKSRAWISVTLLIIAGLLHVRFLDFYLHEASVLNKDIPWQDYFQMNQVIQDKYPGQSVMAGIDSSIGLDKPLVMEVTRSFSSPVEAAIHTQLTPQTFEWMKAMHYYGQTAPFARVLGYDAILWGPVEERVWGSGLKKILTDKGTLLEKRGTVALYRLR